MRNRQRTTTYSLTAYEVFPFAADYCSDVLSRIYLLPSVQHEEFKAYWKYLIDRVKPGQLLIAAYSIWNQDRDIRNRNLAQKYIWEYETRKIGGGPCDEVLAFNRNKWGAAPV
jgi:hypothetical protein